ncbi:PleD family two-component system response regulator [Aciditerrimonas ferrireducens]|uniref:PleD family two-component system response regulator n=1 Tax=Aciditerrimonas ferrireducens TaxID=667306 RepID=A0ABV6C2L5_9ACTN
MARILLASDLPALRQQLAGVLRGPETTLLEVSSGFDVLPTVRAEHPDLVIADLQIGSMGGVAVCMDLRLEASYGAVPEVPVLLLLDRRPDVFLARRCGAEGFLLKPLDPLRLRRAVATLLEGGRFEDDSLRPDPVVVEAARPQAVRTG